MHIHIIGICGTFMGGLAVLAKQAGHDVTGSDANVYPPMSTQLEQQGIQLMTGYVQENLKPQPDVVVIGNALSRGNPEVEAVLRQGIKYTSGPQWLAEHVLQDRWVLAVAGTHGKTTTASMLAWILEYAGMQPGFLIGGVPNNFSVSARLGEAPFFVIEADEYDSAFFDKRSKFIHYRPRTAILNNLEFDHADIFPDLTAIKKQFHHFVRTIPDNGLLVVPSADANIADVLQQGCWTPQETFDINSANWAIAEVDEGGQTFTVTYKEQTQGKVRWKLLGQHNQLNALAAIAAARHAGVATEHAIEALAEFSNVKRRLEVRGEIGGITVYDDFAHHPTAIATTLAGLRTKLGNQRIIAVLEFASNTMRQGFHIEDVPHSFACADQVIFAKPNGVDWEIDTIAKQVPKTNSGL